MRRDVVIGTTAIGIGILSYLWYRKSKPKLIIDLEKSKERPIERHPNPAYQHPTRPVLDFNNVSVNTYKAPYDTFGFGMDSSRNIDSISIDSYLYMPLESDGITYDTRNKYMSLDETPDNIEKMFKYMRFTVLETRGSNEKTVCIGGIRFLRKGVPISDLHVWNPHTGETRVYIEEEWSDSDQWSIVFVFSEAIQIHEYQIKTSNKTPEMDPIQWKLESSNNAAYWAELQTKMSVLPFDRGVVTTFGV
jgi:hypothetical protein